MRASPSVGELNVPLGRSGPNRRGRPGTLAVLLATWRSGYAAACKAVYTGSIPVVASSGTRLAAPRGHFSGARGDVTNILRIR